MIQSLLSCCYSSATPLPERNCCERAYDTILDVIKCVWNGFLDFLTTLGWVFTCGYYFKESSSKEEREIPFRSPTPPPALVIPTLTVTSLIEDSPPPALVIPALTSPTGDSPPTSLQNAAPPSPEPVRRMPSSWIQTFKPVLDNREVQALIQSKLAPLQLDVHQKTDWTHKLTPVYQALSRMGTVQITAGANSATSELLFGFTVKGESESTIRNEIEAVNSSFTLKGSSSDRTKIYIVLSSKM